MGLSRVLLIQTLSLIHISACNITGLPAGITVSGGYLIYKNIVVIITFAICCAYLIGFVGGYLSLIHIYARSRVSSRILFWVNSHYPEIDDVVGVASGGIGWAMTLANCKLLPVLYARRESKDHGLLNQIEGELPKDGAKVVVLDDVITDVYKRQLLCIHPQNR